MAKQRRHTSLDEVSSTGGGTSTATSGQLTVGLFVVAQNFDPSVDTVEVQGEGSAEDTHFATLDRGAPSVDNALQVTSNDFDQSDEDNSVYAAYTVLNNVAIEYVRANLTSLTDSSGGELTVTVYLFIGGWAGKGKKYNNRSDLAND